MISFFWANKRKNKLSTKIRAREIAEFLDAKLSPEEGYENDTCIYLKPNSLDLVPRGAWIDILDGGKFVAKIKNRPDLKLIAGSQASYNYLKKQLPNKIAFIPHQHINWEKDKRTGDVTTCGYTGSYSSYARDIYNTMGKEIKKRTGLEFIASFKGKDRKRATSFYKNIDILFIGGWELGDEHVHKMPTKIINAASFGIPTVAYPLKGYKEVEGYYLPAKNFTEAIKLIGSLKNKDVYNSWVDKIVPMAEKYHIENIANLYKKLK